MIYGYFMPCDKITLSSKSAFASCEYFANPLMIAQSDRK